MTWERKEHVAIKSEEAGGSAFAPHDDDSIFDTLT